MKRLLFSLLLICGVSLTHGQTLLINPYAGNGTSGFSGDGGQAADAEIGQITCMAKDTSGNIYMLDNMYHVVRKITPSGIISTYAGTGVEGHSGDGGPATDAELSSPTGMAMDKNGNMYIAEGGLHIVRKIDPSGTITTFAGSYDDPGFAGDGGSASAAKFKYITALAVDDTGNLYISDMINYRIRKINTAGIISTFVGNGTNTITDGVPATATGLAYAFNQLICDKLGNVYISNGESIKKVSTSGIISNYAGMNMSGLPYYMYYITEGAMATASYVGEPVSLSMADDGAMYLFHHVSQRLAKIDRNGRIWSVTAAGYGNSGNGGPAIWAHLAGTYGIFAADSQHIYVAEPDYARVRKLSIGNCVPQIMNETPYNWTVCKNSGANSINDFFPVQDLDTTDILTWSVVTAPSHGTLSGSYSSTSTGSITNPTSLVYTPATGYSGTDVFSIRVSDGTVADTGVINVTVLPAPTTITGTKTVCAGRTTTLTNTVTGGEWMSMDDYVASVDWATGVVTGNTTGTATIRYSLPSGCYADAVVTVNTTPDVWGYSTLCTGNSLSVFSSPSGGTWSSSNTSIAYVYAATGVVAGMSAGTANLTYRLANGCNAMLEANVLPAAAPITGTFNVCPGTSTTLSHPECCGYWTSSNTARATIEYYYGEVTGVSPGTTMITYQYDAGCWAKKAITVNTLPANIGGVAAVCEGATTTLTCSPAGGTWSSDYTPGATISSTGVVTGVTVSVVNISYQGTNGCARTRNITINETPADLEGSTFICNGSAGLLYPAVTPYGTGTWSSSFAAVASVNATTGWVTAANPGTARITYTLTGNCRKTAVVTVGATPAVITGGTSLCVGGTITLASTSPGHIWSTDDPTIATISSTGVVTGVSNGVTTVRYTTALGCERTTFVTVNDAPAMNTGTPSVCTVSTTTLANATGGGTWSSSATTKATVNTTTGVVTGVAAGTANISYKTGPGCSAISEVTVNPLPDVISGATSVCVAAQTTFTNTVAGGTWSSSNASLGTVDASTGVITGIAAGVPTITYTLPTTCRRTKTITVSPLPGVITGSLTVCATATANLTSAGTTGGVWSSSDAGIATVGSTSGVMTGIAAGTATITRISGAGCVRIATATVNSLPSAISGTLTLCQGTTTALSSPGTTGGTWTSSNATKASVGSASGVVTGVTGGTANITYTWTNGCRRTAQATVTALPTAGAITGAGTMTVSTTQTLTGSVSGGAWTSNNTAIATIDAGTGLMTALTAGNVRITYTVTNTCGSAFVTRLFTIVTARPGDVQAPIATRALSVYPNPTTGLLNIDAPIDGNFTVLTMDGRTAGQFRLSEGANNVTLPNGLPAGMYMARFDGDDKRVETVRIIINR